VTYRVHRPHGALTPGEQRARERVILSALTSEERALLLTLLSKLGLPPDAPWFRSPVRRLFELVAWGNLTAQATARGLTRPAAEVAAATQLACDRRTLQTRLRDYRGNSPALPCPRNLTAE